VSITYLLILNLADNLKDEVQKLLGQGTFGKVVQARDRRRGGSLVAIKIIRSVQKYRDASRIELRVLSTLKANDTENRNRCIHFRDCFDYRGHICIVMDLMGQSVFDFLKGNSFTPFPNSQIQSFARQLFTSVACEYDPFQTLARRLTARSSSRPESDTYGSKTRKYPSL
jgi:dual-specificity kinase